jgi:hypothetical protein
MNGVLATFSSSAGSDHRSGRNASASGPHRSARLCARSEDIIICVLGGRYRLPALVFGMMSGSSQEVRATSGADGKMRRVSLRTACTVYNIRSATKSVVSHAKRTVSHRFEICVGGSACRPKRFEDFFPQAATHVRMQREEVHHKRQKRGRLSTNSSVVISQVRNNLKLSAYGVS